MYYFTALKYLTDHYYLCLLSIVYSEAEMYIGQTHDRKICDIIQIFTAS